jgi:hypothetical protein
MCMHVRFHSYSLKWCGEHFFVVDLELSFNTAGRGGLGDGGLFSKSMKAIKYKVSW